MIEQFLTLIHQGPKPLPTGPGPADIIVGDETDGYYGIMPASELVTGSQLATLTGIVNDGGILVNDNTNWIKVILDGKILYVPMLPIRWGLMWTTLNPRGLVYGTNIVTIQGYRFKVRLMTGWNPGETPVAENYPLAGADKSEFNRILYRMTSEAPTGSNPNQFASYPLNQLALERSGNSNRIICQELVGTNVLLRNGNNGIAATNQWTASLLVAYNGQNPQNGWRPVLELIGK